MYTVSTIVEKWHTPDEWTGTTKRCWGASRVRPGPQGLRFMSAGTPVPYLLHDELTGADDYAIPCGEALKLFTINATTLVG
ncbi:hypothetical protein [Nocardioides alpinus]|nr:hypothetical protein [Nocardioides alpinus]